MLDATLAAFFANDFGERADLGFVDVSYLEACRVHFVSSAHTAYEGDARRGSAFDKQKLGGYCVERVDRVVEGSKVKLVGRVGQEEALNSVYLAGRVNSRNACAHRINLGLPNGFVGSQHLAVDIGFTHYVFVHDGQVPHACARECFSAYAAHAAQAKYGYVCVRKRLNCA